MGRAKDQMIESMEEEREDLEQALDDIECYGENLECPNKHCDSKTCSKSCFARSCFDWCLTHNHSSVERQDGEVPITVRSQSSDKEGKLVLEERVESRRVCGHEDAKSFPGDCKIVTSHFFADIDEDTGRASTAESQLWHFEQERRLGEIMGCDSP